MVRPRRRRWRIVLASAIAAACLLGLLALVLLFLVQAPHGAAQWASVIGALIAVAGAWSSTSVGPCGWTNQYHSRALLLCLLSTTFG